MTIMLQSKMTLPGLDRPLSNLALGTAFYTLAQKESCFALMDAFVDLGGTLIDTARQYGESEAVVGEWLASRPVRDRIVLLTKGAHGGQAALLPAEDFEEAVTRDLAQSQSLLHSDHIDLYLLHRDNPAVPVGRILERLNREVEDGRVSVLGASNWTWERVEEANAYARAHGLQGFSLVSNNLSLAVPTAPFYPRLVWTDPVAEEWHRRTAMPLLVWSSQARGFFTGRYTPDMVGSSDAAMDGFTRRMLEVYGTADNLERLRRARELGERKGGYSAVQVALAWLLHKPFPIIPIVGPHTLDELVSCVEATSLQLTDDECRWLNLS